MKYDPAWEVLKSRLMDPGSSWVKGNPGAGLGCSFDLPSHHSTGAILGSLLPHLWSGISLVPIPEERGVTGLNIGKGALRKAGCLELSCLSSNSKPSTATSPTPSLVALWPGWEPLDSAGLLTLRLCDLGQSTMVPSGDSRPESTARPISLNYTQRSVATHIRGSD